MRHLSCRSRPDGFDRNPLLITLSPLNPPEAAVNHHPTATDGSSSRFVHAIAWILPVALVIALSITYWLSPTVYLEYVLKEEIRETQVVERITFITAFLGGVLLLSSAWQLFRLAPHRRAGEFAAVGVIGIIGLAAIFFAGEEVSWGQTWFGWKTPERYLEHSPETNLHNNDWFIIRVQTLGSIFLATMFFLLPALWTQRRKLNLPKALKPAVPEAAVVFSMAIAFIWKEIKSVYRFFYPDASPDDPGLYGDFIDQFNEIKEMLVAVTLLMYALYRIRAIRKLREEIAQHSAAQQRG